MNEEDYVVLVLEKYCNASGVSFKYDSDMGSLFKKIYPTINYKKARQIAINTKKIFGFNNTGTSGVPALCLSLVQLKDDEDEDDEKEEVEEMEQNEEKENDGEHKMEKDVYDY